MVALLPSSMVGVVRRDPLCEHLRVVPRVEPGLGSLGGTLENGGAFSLILREVSQGGHALAPYSISAAAVWCVTALGNMPARVVA